jgi:hypothetical protein
MARGAKKATVADRVDAVMRGHYPAYSERQFMHRMTWPEGMHPSPHRYVEIMKWAGEFFAAVDKLRAALANPFAPGAAEIIAEADLAWENGDSEDLFSAFMSIGRCIVIARGAA